MPGEFFDENYPQVVLLSEKWQADIKRLDQLKKNVQETLIKSCEIFDLAKVKKLKIITNNQMFVVMICQPDSYKTFVHKLYAEIADLQKVQIFAAPSCKLDVSAVALALEGEAYRFDKYKTKQKSDELPALETVCFPQFEKPDNWKETLALANGIRYAKDLLNSRTYNVAANNGALLPSITLDGSATTSKGDASNNGLYNRDTKVDEVQWGVNMNIPLYTAGETRAKIRQSKYQKWQAQELVLEAERQAISDVTSAWELMTSNRAQIKSIQDQVKANEIALDGVQKEEALGNRTILDVLDAYQELLNSNVNEVKARRDYYVAAMQVLLSMGKLTAENLKLNVELYEPKKFYKETRDKWLSLSID